MRNVTNIQDNFEARQSLYCVWIRPSEQPNAPLVSVWIDPAMRAFEGELHKVNCEAPTEASVTHQDESTGDAVIEDPPLRVHISVMSAGLT